MRDVIVNGVPLRDPLGEWFIDYTRSSTMTELERTLVTEQAYGYHGIDDTRADEGYFGPGRESWVLNVIGDDQATHDRNLRGLLALMQRPRLDVVCGPQGADLDAGTDRTGQSFYVDDDDTVWSSAMQLVGSPALERVNATTSRVTFIVQHLAAFWRSLDSYTSPVLTFATQGGILSLSTTFGYGNAPVTDGQIRIKGPLSAGGSVQVRDRDKFWRGIGWTSPGVLDASTYVILDFATLKATKVATGGWEDPGIDVSASVFVTGDGSFFLTPEVGQDFPEESWDYQSTCLAAGFTAGVTSVQFRGRRSFIS